MKEVVLGNLKEVSKEEVAAQAAAVEIDRLAESGEDGWLDKALEVMQEAGFDDFGEDEEMILSLNDALSREEQ